MNIKKFLSSCLLATIAMVSLQASADNIDQVSARAVANSFLKQQTAVQSFRATALAALNLAHAEASSAVANANAYYAFNINGGGFIIIAGEDRANQVLGYSDHGHLDFNNLPDNFKALMGSYKEEIEFLQAHPDLKITPDNRASGEVVVKPLIKAIWGQEMPYYLQCPIYQNEYCVVGCVATAMTQVMYYWKFPDSSPALNSYYCYDIGQTVPALPETNFEYNKMLTSYCHWDYDLAQLIQDTYTEEQAQAVAKIARYCGQSVSMGYSPEGSGAYTSQQLSAMKKFGFSNSAQDITRSSWWYDNYTDAEWEALIKAELDAQRPILYSANDYSAGGHAFVCDGYDDNRMFHFNFGWYGTCDGWYKSTALNMTHRDGEELHFNYDHEMLTGVEPPTYCVIMADGVGAPEDLFVLGDQATVEALNVHIHTTSSSVKLIFNITNGNDEILGNGTVDITTDGFVQNSNQSALLTLPTTLQPGSYSIKLFYKPDAAARSGKKVDCESATLNVVGHLAKFNAPFTINDVTATIDRLLSGDNANLSINDVTTLIDYLLMN